MEATDLAMVLPATVCTLELASRETTLASLSETREKWVVVRRVSIAIADDRMIAIIMIATHAQYSQSVRPPRPVISHMEEDR